MQNIQVSFLSNDENLCSYWMKKLKNLEKKNQSKEEKEQPIEKEIQNLEIEKV